MVSPAAWCDVAESGTGIVIDVGMIVDGQRMTAGIASDQHLGMIYKLWRDRSEPMPFAPVQGAST
jgi:hypothetical protein